MMNAVWREPEASARETARERFSATGLHVVRALVSPEEVAEIATLVALLECAPETPGRTMKYYDTDPLEPGGRRLNRIENFVPYDSALARVVNGPSLRGMASVLLGGEAVLFKDKINLKLPGGGGFEPHQDAQAGWGAYAPAFVTAAVAIDPATPANGCLEMAHWRHRRALIGPLWEPLHPEHLGGIDFVPLPMAPGDAAFFDEYIPHRSAPNTTAEPRRVLYVTYNRLADGDHRARYYADKRRTYPPDSERVAGVEYAYRV